METEQEKADSVEVDKAALGNMTLAEVIAEAARRWKTRADAEIDIAIADRQGGDVGAAKAARDAASAHWYLAQTAAKEAAIVAVRDVLGVEPAELRQVLP